ncbi:DNA sulfur modification protein DndB [Paenibacillus chungangensis]|uniref:DNA sulfur modification protein DndB n=1 Tax=Paenibacillus chungangensis TaxID=696535 RepID=A0ABW3HU04_9BACL
MDLSGISKRTNQIVLKAIGGTQFNQRVISVQCTVNDVLKFLEIDREVQRDIDTERVASISKYIQYGLEGNDIYFSPLIFSARGQGKFESEHCEYHLNMSERLVILDGQHRIKAFELLKYRLEAMMEQNKNDKKVSESYYSLISFPLTIQIFLDLNINKERQLFTDVNSKSSAVNNTLLVMYKKGDLYGDLVREIVQFHPTINPDEFECRSKTTRTKLATAATLYVLAHTLNEGTIHRKQNTKITQENYRLFKKNTEMFLTLLKKYTPKDALDRDKYVVYSSNVLISIAKFVYDTKIRYPNATMEDIFRITIYSVDWSHKNNDFKKLAAKFNNQTKKYNFGSIGRIVRTFSQYLSDKYDAKEEQLLL